MDPNEFRNKLNEIAETSFATPKRHSGTKTSTETTDVTIDGNTVAISDFYNPTLGVEMLKLKDINKLCELGCGKVVTNQRIESRRIQNPEPHWRTVCKNCDCFVGPDGKTLIEGSYKMASEFNKHYIELKNKSKNPTTDK